MALRLRSSCRVTQVERVGIRRRSLWQPASSYVATACEVLLGCVGAGGFVCCAIPGCVLTLISSNAMLAAACISLNLTMRSPTLPFDIFTGFPLTLGEIRIDSTARNRHNMQVQNNNIFGFF